MALQTDSAYHREGPESGQGGVVRVLSIVAAALVFVLIAGTIIGFATGSRQRKLDREAIAPGSGTAVFTGLGTLRASTADKKPAVVVATIAFPYNGGDRAFKEELIRAAPALKAAAIAYFSHKKAEELAPIYEGAVKASLRDALNSLLSLGKVREIWLSDFSVIQ
jgi:flagellar basal body-associated protein FliL